MKSMISVADICASEEELLNSLDHCEWYLPFIRKMRSPLRRREWLAARVLLKNLAGEEKEIVYSESGKPYLKDDSYKISISHSCEKVAIILNKDRRVGIDIQKISPETERIKEKFLNREEYESIPACPDPAVIYSLFWSAKETVYKAMENPSADFRKIHILKFGPDIWKNEEIEACAGHPGTGNNFKIPYKIDPDYILTFTEV